MIQRFLSILNLISGAVMTLIPVLLSLELVFLTSVENKQLFSEIHGIILVYIVCDLCIRVLLYRYHKLNVLGRMIDALVFIPFVTVFYFNLLLIDYYVIVQFILGLIFLGRLGHIRHLLKALKVQPAQLFMLGFIFFIFIGALLLSLPIARGIGMLPLSFIDAVFTATSAICVTGLVVNDVGAYFSQFGQVVILCLIQLGGLGIMTFYAMVMLFFKNKVARSQSIEYQEVLATKGASETYALIRSIFIYTFFVEALGALCLFFFWQGRFETWQDNVYHSVFHSVSAFCNAGFALFPDSLMSFSTNMGLILTVSILIIVGGLGFPVIFNLRQRLMSRANRVKVQTRLTVFVTVFLIFFGMGMILLGELNHGLASMPWSQKVLMSFFHSVTARSAGFSAMDINHFQFGTILMIVLWMFIGSSPGSTGGGIKTTTFGVLNVALFRVLQGESKVELYGRTISRSNVYRAFLIFFISAIVIVTGLYVLLETEIVGFVPLLFEAVSAFGTVGLSMGITEQLSSLGKLSIIIIMFIGRLGPLSLGIALAKGKQRANYAFPEERILLG